MIRCCFIFLDIFLMKFLLIFLLIEYFVLCVILNENVLILLNFMKLWKMFLIYSWIMLSSIIMFFFLWFFCGGISIKCDILEVGIWIIVNLGLWFFFLSVIYKYIDVLFKWLSRLVFLFIKIGVMWCSVLLMKKLCIYCFW